MATTTLTPRQKEIKRLLDQGKTPGEVAKKLKITENAIYQHMRRIRAANGESKPKRGASATARKRTAAARKRTARRGSAAGAIKASSTSGTAGSANAATSVVREMTPLQAIRHRKNEIESQLKDSERRVTDAEKTLAHEKEVHDKLVGNRSEELKQLEKAESALTGKPANKATAKRNGSGSKGAARQAAAQAAPAAPQQEPAPVPEPDATPAAAEPEAALVGVEEERPGVPVDPEFDQGGQDGFGDE